jgi:hypothetical protein
VAQAGPAVSRAVPSGPGRSNNPFTAPIPIDGVITVKFSEFSSIPDANGQPARMNLILDQPDTRRLFVNTMTGMLYAVSYDGKTVTPYLDINDAKWSMPVQSVNSEQGFQSFAFHPDFAQSGRPGFGKFYTWVDTSNTMPMADFTPSWNGHTHDEVLLEWTARDPKAAAFDGTAPRELFRVAHPFPNHNGGMIAFNALARPTRSARSTRTAIAILSDSRGIPRTATCSRRRSARTSTRRSKQIVAGGNYAGTSGRGASSISIARSARRSSGPIPSTELLP